MERGGHQLFLLHRDDDLLEALVVDLRPLLLGEDVLAEDLDAVADGEDGGCADEEGAEGSVLVARDLARQVGLERVDLGAEKVAVHGDVEAAEELLPALLRTAVDALGEEDEPRARAPDRTALRLKVAERVEQVPAPADVRHGGRLPAGDDEAVASRQLLRLANLDRLTPRAPDVRAVLGERALNGEHADLHFVVSAHLEVPKYDVRWPRRVGMGRRFGDVEVAATWLSLSFQIGSLSSSLFGCPHTCLARDDVAVVVNKLTPS